MLYIFVSNSKQKKKKDNNDRYEQKYASTKYVIVIFSSMLSLSIVEESHIELDFSYRSSFFLLLVFIRLIRDTIDMHL